MDLFASTTEMKEHPLGAIFCIMSGVFGGIFLFAFIMAFDPSVVIAREVDETGNPQKRGRILDLILSASNVVGGRVSWSEYRKVWADTKGIRFLVPLGIALCLISFVLHRIYFR